ncbi:MAG TPA: hypothetical protein VEF33_02305 [Syntrophales bacterium]|nr:hypothetical protein [Syntrophales bacterium]
MEKVAVVKYDATLDSLRRAIELCDGFERLKTSDKILLKPNILWGGNEKASSIRCGYNINDCR